MLDNLKNPRVKNEEVIKFNDKKLESLFNEIKNEYNKNLLKSGVKIPSSLKSKKGDYNKKSLQLCFAYNFRGYVFHKDQVSKFVSFYFDGKQTDQQVRHLAAQDGFYILGQKQKYNNEELKSGEHVLVGLICPHPNYKKDKRINTYNNADFLNYDTCVTCGVKKGEKHRVTGKVIRDLERGHKNPNIELSDDNIIPQCKYCNSFFKDYYILGNNGLPSNINNWRYFFNKLSKEEKQIVLKDLYLTI